MSKTKEDEELRELANKFAGRIKNEEDLAAFSQKLLKMTVETALGAEMEEHLGYPRHDPAGNGSGNSRNGSSSKKLIGQHGKVDINTPRDRNGTFEPKLVKKGQTRLTQFDDQILSFYAQGMSTREIVHAFEDVYGAEVSATLVSKVTDAVIDRVHAWQQRPLEPVYPIVFLDCLVTKIRQDKRVINKSVYIALGITLNGEKDCLGLWIAETEGAKTWLRILTELQNRGLKDILLASIDGLKGFPEAINTVYPDARIQLCIVHLVRNSLNYVSWKERKEVATGLKRIYQSATVAEAEQELAAFSEQWDERFPSISQLWRRNWPNIIALFDYPEDIRRVMYTTNAIESLNSVIRKSIKKRKLFPHDDAALKVIYLAIEQASRRWTMPIRNWKGALNRFMIEFDERITPYI